MVSISDSIAFLIDAEQFAIETSTQIAGIEDACDMANDAMTKVINRLVLVRGERSITTLDQAIGQAEQVMTEVARIAAVADDMNQVVEAITYKVNTYKDAITS